MKNNSKGSLESRLTKKGGAWKLKVRNLLESAT
jgi:hypothetical protein